MENIVIEEVLKEIKSRINELNGGIAKSKEDFTQLLMRKVQISELEKVIKIIEGKLPGCAQTMVCQKTIEQENEDMVTAMKKFEFYQKLYEETQRILNE